MLHYASVDAVNILTARIKFLNDTIYTHKLCDIIHLYCVKLHTKLWLYYTQRKLCYSRNAT